MDRQGCVQELQNTTKNKWGFDISCMIGSFGKIYKAIHQEKNDFYAIKIENNLKVILFVKDLEKGWWNTPHWGSNIVLFKGGEGISSSLLLRARWNQPNIGADFVGYLGNFYITQTATWMNSSPPVTDGSHSRLCCYFWIKPWIGWSSCTRIMLYIGFIFD